MEKRTFTRFAKRKCIPHKNRQDLRLYRLVLEVRVDFGIEDTYNQSVFER
jgi:hypothetical protein